MALAVANNDESTPEPRIGGITGKGFKPGQSGNPSGRPRGIASQARELIDDNPRELLTTLLEIARDPEERGSERRACIAEYLDRAYGKSATFAPIDGEDPLDLTELAQIRTVVDELAARRG